MLLIRQHRTVTCVLDKNFCQISKHHIRKDKENMSADSL